MAAALSPLAPFLAQSLGPLSLDVVLNSTNNNEVT
jgi:hypothetical protein